MADSIKFDVGGGGVKWFICNLSDTAVWLYIKVIVLISLKISETS